MLVTNVKLENFSCGSVHFIGNRFEIEIPAYSIGDDAVLSNIPSDVLAANLAALATKAPYVAVTTLDDEDNGIPWPPIPEFMPYRKNNFSGTATPSVNDDETQGYSVGSVWVNIAAAPHEFYRCDDATEGAALWLNTTLEAGELGTAALSDTEDFEPAGAAQDAVDDHKDATTGVHGAGTGTLAIVSESGYLVGKTKLVLEPET
jgi:hypothetical protein